MTEQQAREIHRAARALVMHVRSGDLHPVDLQRFKLALWGDALRRVDNASLVKAAYVAAGMLPE